MTRTEIRELAFKLLYSFEVQKLEKNEYNEQVEMFLTQQNVNNEKAKTYIIETINGIDENEEKIVELISKNLKQEWSIERISKTSLTLLKIAIYEIFYVKIEYKIIVNEVVEIAKKYGEDNSALFINGILANIIKQEGISKEE